jgi:hypothetical protein
MCYRIFRLAIKNSQSRLTAWLVLTPSGAHLGVLVRSLDRPVFPKTMSIEGPPNVWICWGEQGCPRNGVMLLSTALRYLQRNNTCGAFAALCTRLQTKIRSVAFSGAMKWWAGLQVSFGLFAALFFVILGLGHLFGWSLHSPHARSSVDA